MKTQDKINRIQQFLEDFQTSSDSFELDLRMSLSEIIIQALRSQDITQTKLAEMMGVSKPMITRLIHGESNFTTRTAAKVLHAINTRAKIIPIPDGMQSRIFSHQFRVGDDALATVFTKHDNYEVRDYGEEKVNKEGNKEKIIKENGFQISFRRKSLFSESSSSDCA